MVAIWQPTVNIGPAGLRCDNSGPTLGGVKLGRYLANTCENTRDFATRSGVPRRTIRRILAGSGCTASTALLIIRASRSEPAEDGRTVTLESLVEGMTA